MQLRRVPTVMFVATLGSEVAAVALSWGLEPGYDTAVYALYAVTLAGAGALIASRHRASRIGTVRSLTTSRNQAVLRGLDRGRKAGRCSLAVEIVRAPRVRRPLTSSTASRSPRTW